MMTKDVRTDRQLTADLLKGTAVLLMIQVHVLQLFVRQDVMESGPGKVALFLGGPPVAPIFLAVMGYYALQTGGSMANLLWRGVRLLALGLLLNLGLNAHLLWRIHAGELALNPWEYVFGVDVLFAAGLSLMILALLRPAFGGRAGLWFLAALLVAYLAPGVSAAMPAESEWRWLAAYIGSTVYWSYFPLFPWLAYVLAGAAASCVNLPSILTGRRGWLVLAAGIPALVWSGGPAYEVSGNLPRYYHHDLGFFLWVCPFMVAWAMLHHRLAGWIGSNHWLAWLGRQVTHCYVVQWLLIGNIATALYKTESLMHGVLWVVTLTVAMAAIVSVLTRRH